MPPKTFVIIPAYQAEKTLERVFERFPPEVRERIAGYIAVDDGSTDRTHEVLVGLRDDVPNLTVLRHPENRGYGAAEKTLLDAALGQGAELAVLVHADGQYSPECLASMLAPFETGEADVVQGSRMLGGGALKGGMPLYKYVANRTLTAIENLAFGMKMAEYHSGYMAYSRRFLEEVPYRRFSDSFDFDLEMLLAAPIKGFPIREVPIPTIYADEVSHLNPVKYGWDVLKVVGRYLGGYYHRVVAEREGCKNGRMQG